MRLVPDEFRARTLRVHALLHDIPLEDAWAIPLSGGGAGRTVQDVRAVMLAGARDGTRGGPRALLAAAPHRRPVRVG